MEDKIKELVDAINEHTREIREIKNSLYDLRKKMLSEQQAEFSSHDKILFPPTLYLPHPEWDFQYSNIVDVLEGRIGKLELEVFGMPEEKDGIQYEFNF